ncbi:MAG: DNA repair protein RadC [Gammaproteobacteria bacterium]|nr:DNA repair protein RadC [Gammaproteobacteria bacterium]
MEDTMLSQPVVELSNRDLLALLVGENTADCMLMETGGSLFSLFPDEPCTVATVREPSAEYGWARPREILSAARELARRCLGESLAQGESMNSPRQVKDYLSLSLGKLPYEAFMVLWLDAQNRLIEAEVLFKGTLTQTSVYPREVVKQALAHNAAGVILSHNHPSGTAEASQADRWLTDQLKAALGLVDVKLVDHIIVAGNEHLSFCDRGWL